MISKLVKYIIVSQDANIVLIEIYVENVRMDIILFIR
jgi:hypothetical protein